MASARAGRSYYSLPVPCRPRREFCGLVLKSSLALFATTLPAKAAAFRTVVIDPGHGGHEPGANWYGVQEKHLNLDLAKRVSTLLVKKGVRTVMTRTTDRFVGLYDRADIGNRYSSSIFVSLHFNGHVNRAITGIETYYYSKSSRGKRLAASVQSALAARIRTKNRGIKPKSSFVMLRETNAPAILVECGFLSNSWERKRCNEAWFRQILAETIVNGLMRYRG